MALANFSGNRQLMVKEPNPPPEEAAYRRGQHPMAYRQRVVPQIKKPIIIDLAIIQAILRRNHIDFRVELGLTHLLPFAAIHQ